MLSLLILGSLQIQTISDLGYNEKYDLRVLKGKSEYGIVRTVTRFRIEIQTIEKDSTLKSFPTHRRLNQGICSYRVQDGNSYAVRDILPGDCVTLYLCAEGKVDYCFALSIGRRPGGEIPPSRFPRPFCPYSERQNAINLLKDTGRTPPRYLTGRSAEEYPFADPQVPKEKRLARWPKADPFSYIEFALFMR